MSGKDLSGKDCWGKIVGERLVGEIYVNVGVGKIIRRGFISPLGEAAARSKVIDWGNLGYIDSQQVEIIS